MIVPMIKYNIVLYHRSYKAFLEQLRSVGLVDITTTGWEPGDEQRHMITTIEKQAQAIERLKSMSSDAGFVAGEPFSSGKEAFDNYSRATAEIESLTNRINKENKELESLKVWGDFSPVAINSLINAGVELHFFFCYTKDFNEKSPEWSENYHIESVGTAEGVTYFVVITAPETEVNIDAQNVKVPTRTFSTVEKDIVLLQGEIEDARALLTRCAASVEMIASYRNELMEELHFVQVEQSGKPEAEDTLIVLEGWATKESCGKVDAMLEASPDLIYLKERPTPADHTPVLLKNNSFARLFEFIGGFYSLPKYGSLDLTPYFAPFYMIFFGFCLAEAGYGLILVLGGLYLAIKGSETMKSIGKLTMLCGASTIVFGFMTGSFFGIQLAELAPFQGVKDKFLKPENLFNLAIGIGIVQLLFGMVLKVVSTSMQYGFRYSLATIGWMVVLVSSLAAMGLPEVGVEGFTMASPLYMALLGAGGFMMLFLNTPGANPLINLGSGLWNTYNDVVGFVGDVLSYIRLFAIGLSGGILAMVFNDLAVGLSPDIPLLRELVIVIILLLGHGINLFMSSLGSFVHPMRLTFVEFYKNAGFETGERAFKPFKKLSDN